MSSDDEDNRGAGDDNKVNRALFIKLLQEHVVLLQKSKAPSAAKAKKEAWATLTVDYSAAVGKLVTTAQLTKALQNIKSHIKSKTDIRATGNKPIKMKEWEKEFLSMIEEDNPVYHKIPGSVSVGTSLQCQLSVQQQSKPSTSNQNLEEMEVNEPHQVYTKTTEASGMKEKNRKSAKVVSTFETNETRDLSTSQLQRVVLLQQFQINKLKKEREDILLSQLKKDAYVRNLLKQTLLLMEI